MVILPVTFSDLLTLQLQYTDNDIDNDINLINAIASELE